MDHLAAPDHQEPRIPQITRVELMTTPVQHHYTCRTAACREDLKIWAFYTQNQSLVKNLPEGRHNNTIWLCFSLKSQIEQMFDQIKELSKWLWPNIIMSRLDWQLCLTWLHSIWTRNPKFPSSQTWNFNWITPSSWILEAYMSKNIALYVLRSILYSATCVSEFPQSTENILWYIMLSLFA